MSSEIVIKSIDHIVLTVKDMDATIKFYTEHLGMKHEVFESGGVERHSLKFGSQKINLHQSGHEFEPKATTALPGTVDVCFISSTSIQAVQAYLQSQGIAILEEGEIVARTGAVGDLRSVYVRDPDGNLVEIANYVD